VQQSPHRQQYPDLTQDISLGVQEAQEVPVGLEGLEGLEALALPEAPGASESEEPPGVLLEALQGALFVGASGVSAEATAVAPVQE
jgi:hypothetical protein